MNASNRALGWNTWLTFAISPTAPYWRNANQASGDEVGLVQTGTDTGRPLFTHCDRVEPAASPAMSAMPRKRK
jgi:hypothetical protein